MASSLPSASSQEEVPSVPTGSKRQRKPNVRLGEIGFPLRRPNTSKRSKRSTFSPSVVTDTAQIGVVAGTSENKNISSPSRSRRPKALPLPPPDDLDINDQIEDPDSKAILRVSDSEEPSPSSNSKKSEEIKSDPSNQNQVEDEQRANENGGCGLAEIGGVRGWLDRLGLSRYGPVFDIHEVDETVLPLLTLEDLKDMGINAVGSRRKLYCAIQELNKGVS